MFAVLEWALQDISLLVEEIGPWHILSVRTETSCIRACVVVYPHKDNLL